MALAGPDVQLGSDPVAAGLGEGAHAGAFGEVLTDQAVKLLDTAPLPGVAGSGEVAAPGNTILESFATVELRSVVERRWRGTERGGGQDAVVAIEAPCCMGLPMARSLALVMRRRN